MPRKTDSEIDKVYLEHQSQSVGQAHSRTFPLLQFLITMNLAYLGALWILNKEDLWAWNAPRDMLSVLIFIINLCFAVIYIREIHINRILRNEFYKEMIDSHGKKETKDSRDRIKEKDKMPKWTGRILTGLFVWMVFIPSTYLLLLHCCCISGNTKNWLVFILSIIFTIILTWVITWRLIERDLEKI